MSVYSENLDSLMLSLDTNKSTGLTDSQAAEKLMQAAQQQAQAGQAQQQQAQSGAKNNGDDVVDAEFEEVKDNK